MEWCEVHGVSYRNAEYRIDEAVRVIASMGSIRPVTSSVPVMHFVEQIKKRFKKYERLSQGIRLPDYLCFIGYVHTGVGDGVSDPER